MFAIISAVALEGFPSGQRDQTVNLTAQPSLVRIQLPPPLSYLYLHILSVIKIPTVTIHHFYLTNSMRLYIQDKIEQRVAKIYHCGLSNVNAPIHAQ